LKGYYFKEKMNPLIVLINPSKGMKEFFENPRIDLAILIVLLPAIVSLFFTIFYGFKANIVFFLYQLFTDLVLWIITAIVFYLTIFIFFKDIRKNLQGIFSAIGINRVFLLSFAILLYFIPLLVSFDILSIVKQAAAGNISQFESFQKISKIVMENPESINIIGLTILTIVSIVLTIFYFYSFYALIRHSTSFNRIKSFILLIVFLVLMFAVNFLLKTFLGVF
jgi:hypothetical protein